MNEKERKKSFFMSSKVQIPQFMLSHNKVQHLETSL